MQVGGAEDQGFFVAEGIEFLRQLCADDPVKAFGDNAAVKGFDFKIKFVFQFSQFYFTGLGVDDANLAAFVKMNAVLGKQGFLANRRLMVDQPVVGHCFPVAVGKNRFAENFRGMFGGCCSQAYFDGIKII